MCTWLIACASIFSRLFAFSTGVLPTAHACADRDASGGGLRHGESDVDADDAAAAAETALSLHQEGLGGGARLRGWGWGWGRVRKQRSCSNCVCVGSRGRAHSVLCQGLPGPPSGPRARRDLDCRDYGILLTSPARQHGGSDAPRSEHTKRNAREDPREPLAHAPARAPRPLRPSVR